MRSRGAAQVWWACWPAPTRTRSTCRRPTRRRARHGADRRDRPVLARTDVISDRFAPVLRELQPLSDRFAAAGHRLFLVGGTVRDVLLSGTRRRARLRHRCHHHGSARRDQAMPAGLGRRRVDPGRALRHDRRHEAGAVDLRAAPGDMIERIYEITTHRAEAYQRPFAQARRRVLDRHPCRPVPPRLHRERDGHRSDRRHDRDGGPAARTDRPVRRRARPARPCAAHRRRAETSFSDDPLRMLRAARFIASYRLQPEPTLLRAVRSMADRMQIVSAERIRDELDKLLAAPRPAEGLRFVAETGLLQYVVPELAAAASQADAACHPHMWAHVVALVDAQGRARCRRRPVRFERGVGPARPAARTVGGTAASAGFSRRRRADALRFVMPTTTPVM